MMKCFLDMDGVLDDFVDGCCRAHNRSDPFADSKSYGIFDIEKIWGITADEFWEPLDTFDFWYDLKKTPEADAIVGLLSEKFGMKNIAILSAPSNSTYCIPAKRAWLETYYPELVDRMIFAKAKEFLAGTDRVLVDDRDRNIDGFIEAGGKGVLVPRLWNRAWKLSGSVVDVIDIQLA